MARLLYPQAPRHQARQLWAVSPRGQDTMQSQSGTEEKFKRLNRAYELILNSRGEKP